MNGELDVADTDNVEMGFDEQKSGSLIKLLQEFSQLESKEDATELVMPMLKDLTQDRLIGALMNDRSLKPCLDVALENRLGLKFKVTEIGAERSCMYKHIIPQLSTQPQLQVEYTVAVSDRTSQQLDTEYLEELGVANAVWNIQSPPPNPLTKSDLVVANDVLHRQPCLQDALNQLKGVVIGLGHFRVVSKPFLRLPEPRSQSFG